MPNPANARHRTEFGDPEFSAPELAAPEFSAPELTGAELDDPEFGHPEFGPGPGLYDTLFRRRDTRAEFTGAPIEPAVLNRVLSAAHAAPSVGLSQPWDFVLVSDPVTRRAFRDHVQAERSVFAAQLDDDRAEVFARIKVEGVLESSLGIVVSYDPSKGAPAVLGRHAIADAGLYSVCLAIQNLWLAATAEGLGVGWVSFYQEDFLRRLVGLPAALRPVAWLCVGPVAQLPDTPDLERHGWRRRAPLSSVVHHGRYHSSHTD